MSDTMRKDEQGRWVDRNGEMLYAVHADLNRILIWARTEAEAIRDALWEQYTRRNRRPPPLSEVAARLADDSEAASLLRRRPQRQTAVPVSPAQTTLDGIPRDPRLDQFLRDSPGLVHQDAPSTSRKAARKIAVKTGTQRHAILAAIAAAPAGLTDDQIQQRGFNANSVRPRRIELLEGGFIESQNTPRNTRTGSPAIVWIATRKGLDALAACAEPGSSS